LKLKPEEQAFWTDLAWSLAISSDATRGESAEAIELAKRAVAARPEERPGWKALGLAYVRAGQWPLAAEALQQTMKRQSEGGDAVDRLLTAVVDWRRGDKKEALESYIRALDWLSTHPEDVAGSLALRAEAEALLGRTPAAGLRPGVISHEPSPARRQGPVP
jgi:tetratricopeptide (TPR) repeat protein